MSYIYSIRMAGAGSHGLIDSARILAEAAAIYEDLYAAESCSFGPEARGNTCRADIIISDEVIEYPRAGNIDLLLTFTQESCDLYLQELKPGGILVADDRIDVGGSGRDIVVSRFSLESLGMPLRKVRHLNIIALGLISGSFDVVGERSIRKAIVARSPKTLEKACIAAFETGLDLLLRPSDESDGSQPEDRGEE
ncbi:MAG TPA: 2-oxoacid:acceptor oxidoreductase family protein [Candidatus Krumholzibacterium sp.]|nr:2-oxoacid:acceptor oxidoreductase family protein [Candidatus Krumholzibacterium sp.]